MKLDEIVSVQLSMTNSVSLKKIWGKCSKMVAFVKSGCEKNVLGLSTFLKNYFY